MKTPYSSFCSKGIANGCKFCVRGTKLVLFISGRCSRNCWYCSLSKKRKEIDKIWANEREVTSVKEMIEEVKESNAIGAGITGGDPLLCLPRTIKFVRALKEKFGKKFHIHIYLPTKLVNLSNLQKLSKYVDEVRFHPEFLINGKEDIEKIRLAKNYWNKSNIGVELPMLPNKKNEIVNFIRKIENDVGFVNLNEFELSDTNFNLVTKNYRLDKEGYTIKGSIDAGKWVINQLKKTNLKIHLCTAELKNNWQFKNRLKLHNILLYGKKTSEGLVIYFVIEGKIKSGWYDKKKDRTIIPANKVRKLMGKHKVYRVEEYPTYDAYEVEKNEI